MIASKKTIKCNDVGKHCDMLIEDFFNFNEGHADLVKLIDIRDINEPMPPKQEQLRKMMARCQRAWLDYCNFVGLSRQSQTLFLKRVEQAWQSLEQQQQQKMQQLQFQKESPSAIN